MAEVHGSGDDLIAAVPLALARLLGVRMRYGLGYGLFCDSFGWGGSLVIIDPAARMVAAFVTNQLAEPGTDGEYRGLEIAMAAHEGLAGLRARRGRPRTATRKWISD